MEPRRLRGILVMATAAALWSLARPAATQDPGDAQVRGPDLTVTAVRVLGMAAAEPSVRLPRRLPIRVGRPYTTERVEATDLVLRQALAEAGRPYAAIEVGATVDHGAGTAVVTFEVTPGPLVVFGDVEVRVAPPLRERDVRARVAFRPGDPVRPSSVERTRQRLLALPGVENAVVELQGLEQGALVVPAVVRVARPDRLSAFGGRASLSSVRCIEVAGGWRHQYFLGEPRIVDLSGGFSNLLAPQLGGGGPCASAGEDVYAQPNYFASAELVQPVRAVPATSIQVRGFFRRTTAAQSYLLHGFGVHLSGLRELTPDTRLRVSYFPERNEVRAAGHYFCAHFGACDEAAIDRLGGWHWLAPVELAVQWLPAATLQPFGPEWAREAGLWPGAVGPRWRPMGQATLTGAAGISGSHYEYVRLELEGAATRVLTPRTEVAARVRTGLLGGGDGVLPPQVRFYSGGPVTVRGARQNLLGPLVLVAPSDGAAPLGCEPVAGGCPPGVTPSPDQVSVRPLGGRVVLESNLEGRLWLSRAIQMAVFVDAGTVRGDSGLGSPARRWEGTASPGVGLRWLSPLGPLRVDFGYDTRPPRAVPMLLDDATGRLVHLGDVRWAPHTHDEPSAWTEFRRRLQIHFAFGQPF